MFSKEIAIVFSQIRSSFLYFLNCPGIGELRKRRRTRSYSSLRGIRIYPGGRCTRYMPHI
jgi:hypothetical protein